MKKRILTAVFIVFAMAALCSCGAKTGSETPAETKPETSVETVQQETTPQLFFSRVVSALGLIEGQSVEGVSASADKFLKDHPDVFRTQNADAGLINETITYRDVNKNIEKAGEALMVLPAAKISEITEKKQNDGSFYSVAKATDEENGQEYVFISMGEFPGVYQGDTVTVTGLPLSLGTEKNAAGSSVPVILMAAVSAEPVKEEATDPDFIVGGWSGEGGRWGIDFTKEGNTYAAAYRGSGSAATGAEGTMHCSFDGSEYSYQDGEYRSYRYGSQGDGPAWITEYTDATGSFIIVNEEELEEYLARDYGEMTPSVLAKEWAGVGDNAKAAGDDPRYLIWFDSVPTVWASDEYIIWYSDTLKLSEEDISSLSADQLRIARNEIYARYGRRFQSQDLQSHFDACSWYTGTVGADKFNENVLSAVEKENVKFLEAHESGKAASAAGDPGTEGTIFDLMASDIVSLYLAENYYNYQSDHDLYSDTYQVADWVGNCIGNADAEMMQLSRNIGNNHTWLFGTGSSNNITNNFREYYTTYFMLKDYYNSGGKNSASSYRGLLDYCRGCGYSDPASKLLQLYNDIQPLITASNNKIRAMKK